MEDFNDRSEAAFAGICKAMQDDPLIYASAELDLLRQAVQHDPVAAYTYILACLRPSHVDAQMTAELRIAAFALLKGETVPASYQRLLSYVNCLDAANRPDDNTLKRHMKRAIKGDDAATKLYMSKLESMMDREPPIDFAAFCQGLLRKYEEHTAETAQEAALNTESKQSSIHHESEKETVMYSQGKGGRGGKGKGGRGGRGKGRSMGKGQADARIGAMYYGKGGYGEDYDGYGYYAEQQPFYRGGYRHNGGRGYQLDGKGSSSGGKSYYQDSNKRQVAAKAKAANLLNQPSLNFKAIATVAATGVTKKLTAMLRSPVSEIRCILLSLIKTQHSPCSATVSDLCWTLAARATCVPVN